MQGYVEYEEKILDKLRGQFAFVIYDNKSGELFMARDRIGIKPLYYSVNDSWILFSSEMKFDSGTGWPSFFDYLPNALEFKTDFKLVIPRKEYHCSRCGGHHGHVFKDGPEPTGLRYCNNGLVLNFIPD